NSIKVFAPATVANVGPGFDIFGMALGGVGDQLEMCCKDESGITIRPIEGYEDLPTDPKKNVVGVVIQSILEATGREQGFDVTLHKNVLPGSGLGSSASSSAAAAYAANELLGRPFSAVELVPFAMLGEQAASGKAHADNVAPSLLGGFTMIRSYSPLDVVNVNFPGDLYITVVHPQIEIKTSDSKRILKKEIPLESAIQQWGNAAGLVLGLTTSNYDLIARSLEDIIVEPVRSVLIPYYNDAKSAALNAGALGCSISGSGPSIFALSRGEDTAQKVASAFKTQYDSTSINHLIYVSKISADGAKTIE
ncbi:MAG: homoserine kinase, partial [Bacteroidota bacterium]